MQLNTAGEAKWIFYARTIYSASRFLESRKTDQALISSPKDRLTWAGLSVVADAVDYVMGDFGILWNGQHVVAGAGYRVSHQKHPVPLSL